MSGIVIPATQASTTAVSGVDTKIISVFKVDFTITISTKIEIVSTVIPKERLQVSSSATVARWRRVARLARIAIGEDEIVELCTQLDSIMSFVEQLPSGDMLGVEPMTSVTPMTMKMREDKVTDGGIPDAIIQNAPAHEDHFFVVPKVVE